MIALISHSVAAKALADSIGDRFLAYLLAMTIQEAETLLAGTRSQVVQRRRRPRTKASDPSSD